MGHFLNIGASESYHKHYEISVYVPQKANNVCITNLSYIGIRPIHNALYKLRKYLVIHVHHYFCHNI